MKKFLENYREDLINIHASNGIESVNHFSNGTPYFYTEEEYRAYVDELGEQISQLESMEKIDFGSFTGKRLEMDSIPEGSLRKAVEMMDEADAAELDAERQRLLGLFNSLDDRGRQIMNLCFTNITGYEFTSIAQWSEDDEEDE